MAPTTTPSVAKNPQRRRLPHSEREYYLTPGTVNPDSNHVMDQENSKHRVPITAGGIRNTQTQPQDHELHNTDHNSSTNPINAHAAAQIPINNSQTTPLKATVLPPLGKGANSVPELPKPAFASLPREISPNPSVGPSLQLNGTIFSGSTQPNGLANSSALTKPDSLSHKFVEKPPTTKELPPTYIGHTPAVHITHVTHVNLDRLDSKPLMTGSTLVKSDSGPFNYFGLSETSSSSSSSTVMPISARHTSSNEPSKFFSNVLTKPKAYENSVLREGYQRTQALCSMNQESEKCRHQVKSSPTYNSWPDNHRPLLQSSTPDRDSQDLNEIRWDRNQNARRKFASENSRSEEFGILSGASASKKCRNAMLSYSISNDDPIDSRKHIDEDIRASSFTEAPKVALLVLWPQRLFEKHHLTSEMKFFPYFIESAWHSGIPIAYIAMNMGKDLDRDADNFLMSYFKESETSGSISQSDIVDEIRPAKFDALVVRTNNVAALNNERILEFLEKNKINTLVLIGSTASTSILSTYTAACEMNLRVFVMSDLCTDFNSEVHQTLMNCVFKQQGTVLSSHDWVNQNLWEGGRLQQWLCGAGL